MSQLQFKYVGLASTTVSYGKHERVHFISKFFIFLAVLALHEMYSNIGFNCLNVLT